jgi:hypothetical protein
MLLYQSDTYAAGILTMTPAPGTHNPGGGGRDGADAHNGNFRDRTFWTGLGFSAAVWDFSTVESRGYPILRGVGGQ